MCTPGGIGSDCFTFFVAANFSNWYPKEGTQQIKETIPTPRISFRYGNSGVGAFTI